MSLMVSYDNGDAINRLPLAGAADLLPANHESAMYARASTAEQDASNQIPGIERLCAARGWTIVDRYVETISGAARERPQLKRMLADAHAGRFQAVAVWALDRSPGAASRRSPESSGSSMRQA